jgi:hypothetical protein
MGKLVEICLFAAFGGFMPSSVRMTLEDSRSSNLVHVLCDGTSHLQRRLIWSIQELVNGLGSSLSPLEPIYRLLLKGLASRNHVCLGPWIT